jgi:hypothetical protein
MMEIVMTGPDVPPSPAIPSTPRRILRRCWLGAAALALLFRIGVCVVLEPTTFVDEQGFVHEPFFFLIPMAWLFALSALILGGIDFLIALRRLTQEAQH